MTARDIAHTTVSDHDEDTQREPAARSRSQSRELAMKLLYMLDLRTRADVERDLHNLTSREMDGKEGIDFAVSLFKGTADLLEELDNDIRGAATNWDVDRMACIDRALLRLGTYELLHCADIPPKVTISEAVELAKRYSTERSSGFVNGVLDKIFQEHCPRKE